MSQTGKGSSVVFVIIIAVLLQFVFVKAQNADSPNRAVVDFAEKYFKFDPDMANRLCDERKAPDDVDVVEQYIQSAKNEALERGFDLSYLKSCLYEIKTHTIKREKDRALIRLECKRKQSLLRTFFDPKVHRINELVEVSMENGLWKVCGDVFDLP